MILQYIDGLNIPATEMHGKLAKILERLSFRETQVEKIQGLVKKQLQEALSLKVKELESKKQELAAVVEKIDNLEEKMINGDIESQTYKKWYKKLSIEKAHLSERILELSNGGNAQWEKMLKQLPILCDIPRLIERASLSQKHLLLAKWFQPALIYDKGVFETGNLHAAFRHNELKFKEKGLLIFKQPSVISDQCPIRSGIGSWVESIRDILIDIEIIINEK